MTSRLLQRPIYGGVFGHGQYALATMPTISKGLHAVRFLVIEPRRGAVLSVADDKLAAMAGARRVLLELPVAKASNDAHWEQPGLWPELPIDRPAKVRPISQRRREVFGRSGGCCHYCHAALLLESSWHVEHQLPRALGGGDDALNLVAACAACNLSKGSRSALEYVTRDVATLRPANRAGAA